ncbi:MAG: tetratricopeptide repeat protein [Pseudomonadota bacterium]
MIAESPPLPRATALEPFSAPPLADSISRRLRPVLHPRGALAVSVAIRVSASGLAMLSVPVSSMAEDNKQEPAAQQAIDLAAIIATGPVAEMTAIGLRSCTAIPATIVRAAEPQAIAALTGARYVIDEQTIWDVRTGKAVARDATQAQVVSAALAIANAQGRALSAVELACLSREGSKSPQAAQSWANGRTAFRERRFADAEKLARAAIGKDGSFSLAFADLAMALTAQQRFEEAEAAAEQAIRLDAASPVSRLARAKLFDYRGNVSDAEQAYRQVLQVSPVEFDALNNLGLILLHQRQLAAAVAMLEKARMVDPLRVPVMVNLGLAYLELGKTAEAVSALRQAKLLRSDDPDVRAYLARSLLRTGALAEAKIELADAEKLVAAKGMPLPSALAQVAAESALASGNPAQARLVVEQALGVHPRSAPLLTLAATVYETSGDLAQADQSYRRAIEIEPRGAFAARRNLALLAARRGDLGEAGRILQEQLALAPKDPEAHYNMAVLAIARKDLARARQELTVAIELDNGFAAAAYNLGLVETQRGALAAAEKALRHALELLPRDDGEARLALAVVLRRRGDGQGALTELRQVIERSSGWAQLEAKRACGLLLWERGLRQEAMPLLQEFVDNASASKDVEARAQAEELIHAAR